MLAEMEGTPYIIKESQLLSRKLRFSDKRQVF